MLTGTEFSTFGVGQLLKMGGILAPSFPISH